MRKTLFAMASLVLAYQQNNTALQFRNSSTGDVFTGSITGNTLTVTQFGDVYVFRR